MRCCWRSLGGAFAAAERVGSGSARADWVQDERFRDGYSVWPWRSLRAGGRRRAIRLGTMVGWTCRLIRLCRWRTIRCLGGYSVAGLCRMIRLRPVVRLDGAG